MRKIIEALILATVLIFSINAQGLKVKNKSSLPDKLPSFPNVPAPLGIDTVSMGDSRTFPEIKLANLPLTPGPFEPTWESIEKNYPGEPNWLREAKFGIWVHFGPQSAGESGDWYARNLYKSGHVAYNNHIKRYGHPSEVGYKDVLNSWNPTKLNPAALTKIYEEAGARFLMIQGVHHDNFDLWDSKYQPWNSVNIGPKRDLIGEWAKACRANGMRFGVTFHHEYTWWWWQTAFGSDKDGDKKGVPYDGNLTLADGKGKWWEGYDPRLLYGINLREYKGVSKAAASGWSPPPAGIFANHIDYAKWYTTQWALRMMDVVEHYDPDFIYTDGTSTQPFSGNGTGTGIKADAMQRVIADFYNRALQRRGQVNTFSIVKFRHNTNGTVNTEEFGIPADINAKEPWIAEAPVGDWFYAPGFTYNSGMMIRYIIEAIARDGNAALCISILPDGSLDEGSREMLKEVGVWMKRNGEAVYGSHAWKIPGEGEIVNGKLKMLPGGALQRKHAEFKFDAQDIRFTVGKNGSLYAFCMNVPTAGSSVKIKSLATETNNFRKPVKSVQLLGYKGKLNWKQEADGLTITCPEEMPYATSVVFKID
ncbi:alpha-L-fucosidase [Paludibacter jiangxiensis]|uniref:alpha-L-fucosidase n=1 Tax=Paludibacter jiangxiensis TaxID=681398 RepID=A0A171AFA7_9BACT|nr:alpha-L-fucosidase [Paludibacter jiangxiensis]GAT63641.1 alpha-L-fucosidase [Paludibacter jiangxiensis]